MFTDIWGYRYHSATVATPIGKRVCRFYVACDRCAFAPRVLDSTWVTNTRQLVRISYRIAGRTRVCWADICYNHTDGTMELWAN